MYFSQVCRGPVLGNDPDTSCLPSCPPANKDSRTRGCCTQHDHTQIGMTAASCYLKKFVNTFCKKNQRVLLLKTQTHTQYHLIPLFPLMNLYGAGLGLQYELIGLQNDSLLLSNLSQIRLDMTGLVSNMIGNDWIVKYNY